jgi:enoyl-CoA hydratase/carnithine racemase
MADAEDKPPIRTERRGSALFVVIDREERRNAMNKQVLADITAAVQSTIGDPSIRAIVLTGAGTRAFCAGADLSTGTGTFTLGLDEPMTDFGRLARLVRTLGIPLVGRINGDCVAGGMGLMSLCDLAIATERARFGLPEGKVGVFPMQVLVFLRAMIGARHINELCLTGDLITAARAAEIGLINQVVPADGLDEAVDTLLGKLSAMSPVALRRGKYAIAAMEAMAFPEAMAFAEQLIAVTSLTSDATEGLAAFNERRKPNWVQE